jgi:hypothetical protein
MEHLIELYFRDIHPWIPVIHESKFKEQMKNEHRSKVLTTILHAITSVTARLSEDSRLSKSEVQMHYEQLNRERVIISSMESFSVENLQALIIIAFDIVINKFSLFYLKH